MKKVISLFLVVIMLCSVLVGCNTSGAGETTDTTDTETSADTKTNVKYDTQNSPVDTWSGSIAGSYDGGNGSEAAPYKIATAEQLARLAFEINNGVSYTGKHFVLTAHLDLANISWKPIGTNTRLTVSLTVRGIRYQI